MIELMASLSIIGALISFLLPATQAAREASRRIACGNNLRQIGVALINYETAHKSYPIGAHSNPIVGFGVSWWTDILPQMEEAQLYSNLNLNIANAGNPVLAPGNGEAVDKVVISVMRCPTSDIPALWTTYGLSVCLPSYTGIAGATNEDGLSGTPTQTCCQPTMNGTMSAAGTLIPYVAVRRVDVTDGVSHTLPVAEQSDFAVDQYRRLRNIDAGYLLGWLTGTTSIGAPPVMRNPVGINPSPTAAWNITTVKYPPNTRSFELPGVKDNDHGPNNPLISPHTGGVNGLLLDGSVHFIEETIDMLTLRRLSVRNDGGSASL